MSEVEKQESQKTVVAFITGLLIGGLLVWVFSSTPENTMPKVDEKTDTEETSKSDTPTTQNTSIASDTSVAKETVSEGSVVVLDQKAGKTVVLVSTKTPTKNGWVVVRDYMNGIPGNILGAARYSSDEGLLPTAVTLMRETTVGSTYQVVFFTNEGDASFKTSEDKVIDGIATTFKATK